MSPSPGPGPRFSGPGLRDPGDPVPDADPCVELWGTPQILPLFVDLEIRF